MSALKNQHTLSRSEQLRLKKQQPVQRRSNPVAPSKPTTPVTSKRAVPVVSRNYPYGTPLRQAANTQPRRKVYYASGANGVEVRMPSLPIVNFNLQWVSGLLALCCLIGSLLLTKLPMFAINTVEIEGIQRLSPTDLQVIIHGSASSVFTLDRREIANDLAIAFPELKNIKLKVNLPDVIQVSATERQPVLAWNSGEQTLWIDTEGVVMPVRGEVGELLTVVSSSNPPLTRPIDGQTSVVDYALMVIELETNPLTPEASLNNIDPTVMKAAISLSAMMPQGATLVYDSISGMGWSDPGGWRVYFGTNLENIQFKLVEYQAIVDRLNAIGIRPAMISVEHVDAPYYRVE